MDIFMWRSTLNVWKAQCFPLTGPTAMTLSILAMLAPIVLPLSVLLGARISDAIENAAWAI